jgi:hypothetical protein
MVEYQGESSRLLSHRQQAANQFNINQVGLPNAAAKCATAVSTETTMSKWCISAAVLSKF